MVSAVNFLTRIILARGPSPAEFGRFSLVWLAVFLAQCIQLADINHIGGPSAAGPLVNDNAIVLGQSEMPLGLR